MQVHVDNGVSMLWCTSMKLNTVRAPIRSTPSPDSPYANVPIGLRHLLRRARYIHSLMPTALALFVYCYSAFCRACLERRHQGSDGYSQSSLLEALVQHFPA